MPSFTCDVVICGAGVAGLTLASMLGRNGLAVTLIEKQRRFRMAHKGELLQPSSLEILDQADLLGPLRSGGACEVTALACRTADGLPLVSLDYRLLSGRFRYGMTQSYREMLSGLADGLGPMVTVLRGATCHHLLRDGRGRVAGVAIRGDHGAAEIRATVTVAADGRASRLRHAAGITADIRQYGHHLVGFELENAPYLGSEMNAYLTRHGLRALFALPGQRARLYAQIPAGSFRGVGKAGVSAWTEWLQATTPVLNPVADQLRASADTMQVLSACRFLASRWTQPGFALVGDAAHCVHPMVGQGMNAAIGDARDLSDALTDSPALTPARADSALLQYERNRRPRLAYVARMSHNLAVLLTSTSYAARLMRPRLLQRNQDNLRLRERLTHNVAGLTTRPLTLRDWVSVSGIFNGVPGHSEAADDPEGHLPHMPATASGPGRLDGSP